MVLQQQMLPNLKVSPAAVVPQEQWQGWMILDLSFPVCQLANLRRHLGPVLAPSMNAATTSQAPQLPVQELNMVLPKLFTFLHEVPADEHILFSKIDLSDVFWHVVVSTEDAWNFCFVLLDQPRTATHL